MNYRAFLDKKRITHQSAGFKDAREIQSMRDADEAAEAYFNE